MHSILTADLAALLSQHGPAILYRGEVIPPEAVTQYWSASRKRFDLWNQTLSRYRVAEKSGDSVRLRAWWREHISVLEEIFVGEMLTRVLAALAAGLDEQSDTEEVSPVTHAIYLSHLESRNRVQQMMLFGRGNSVQDAVKLNRLRQGTERWIDALIGRMSIQTPTTIRYAIRPERAGEFASEMRGYGHGPGLNTASTLMNTAMHDMLQRRTTAKPALPVANRAVAESVLMMLRPDLFDSVGHLKSLWLHRMEMDAERTDRVLDELADNDLDKATTASAVEMTHEKYFERWYM